MGVTAIRVYYQQGNGRRPRGVWTLSESLRLAETPNSDYPRLANGESCQQHTVCWPQTASPTADLPPMASRTPPARSSLSGLWFGLSSAVSAGARAAAWPTGFLAAFYPLSAGWSWRGAV